jgi:hypothetical protein
VKLRSVNDAAAVTIFAWTWTRRQMGSDGNHKDRYAAKSHVAAMLIPLNARK